MRDAVSNVTLAGRKPRISSEYEPPLLVMLFAAVKITPMSQMNEDFARRVTGGEELTIEQKKQIQEQQQVSHHRPISLTLFNCNPSMNE